MEFHVYILLSPTIQKYYVGQTNDVKKRLISHNSAQNISTKHGIPWQLIYTTSFITRAEAVQLERKIKKRGIKRYLEDLTE